MKRFLLFLAAIAALTLAALVATAQIEIDKRNRQVIEKIGTVRDVFDMNPDTGELLSLTVFTQHTVTADGVVKFRQPGPTVSFTWQQLTNNDADFVKVMNKLTKMINSAITNQIGAVELRSP